MSEYSLYLIQTKDGALYTGITTDVARRFGEHQDSPKGAKALRGRGPLTLVFNQSVGDRSRASRLEHKVKRLSKPQKLALIDRRLELSELLDD
ncbi:GIY-YIG nuclease family protein [Paraferrimonas sedimenticola]|uniref:UPF0213 protein YhbQ n=1 Tax=Paraferrimonas sedimenticola TaxID=375674 RepID=A0AA37RV26_9GAMM|nr:GIY-YIG nuclease family protein [Paraferrimonas sedimenticola]GLP95931.1 UPF0213 protein YhbQ [Paraferrimonas sedimenticola]